VSECLYQLPETTLRKLAEDVAKKVGFAAPVSGTYSFWVSASSSKWSTTSLLHGG
jgi:hypothetical protein